MVRWPFTWSLILCVLCPFMAEANDCDQRVKIYEGVKKGCDTQRQFCEDVDQYCELALKACGPQKGISCGGTSGDGGSASASGAIGQDVPSYSEDNLPASCAYFTRARVECEARLNYHQVGALVCFQDKMYECISVGGQKRWVRRATCKQYPNGEKYRAEKLEGKAQPCSLFEEN